MKVIIYRGISGSGKSSHIKQHAMDPSVNPGPVFSADNYFSTKEGEYKFDPAKLGEAHASCLRGFTQYCIGQERAERNDGAEKTKTVTIYVDNTNCAVVDLAPYAAIAQAYGHEVLIITLLVDMNDALKRNVHGVSEKTIRAQNDTLYSELELVPRRWKQIVLMEKGGVRIPLTPTLTPDISGMFGALAREATKKGFPEVAQIAKAMESTTKEDNDDDCAICCIGKEVPDPEGGATCVCNCHQGPG